VNQLKQEPAAAQFALATAALALTVLLAWAIYYGIAGYLPVDSSSGNDWGLPTLNDLWWGVGGFVAGAIAAFVVLTVVWIAAMFRRESVWVLSLGSNLGVAVGGVVIAGFLFYGIHWWSVGSYAVDAAIAASGVFALSWIAAMFRREPVWLAVGSVLMAGVLYCGIHADQYRMQLQIAESNRQQEIEKQKEARAIVEAAEEQRRWDHATQRMAQLKPGSVASTLAAAGAQSPQAVLHSLGDGLEPFLERHPWRTLSDDDRAAFDSFARRALKTMGRNGTDSEVSSLVGLVIGTEHGLADTRGAMDECRRLHAGASCQFAIAGLTLDLCRNGPSCLDGYRGMDFVKLSRDIYGPASWDCMRTPLRDTELCAYVRGAGEKVELPKPATAPGPSEPATAPEPPKPAAAHARSKSSRTSGSVFTDCQDGCPQMVVIPAGNFTMGSPADQGRAGGEGPQHTVAIRSLAVGKYDVTFAQWDACVASGGCNGYRPEDQGWGRDNRPVINVSWADAQSYVQWLSGKTGKPYRLLSESEWEYAARAGTTTAFYWGDAAGSGHADCDGCGSRWDGHQTSPAGSFAPNAFGLHDMAGDVWQWVQDCHRADYSGVPSDGAAVESAACSERVFRGGSWGNVPAYLRSATRSDDGYAPLVRRPALGFRVAQDL
jgi:formylglycine-generating enzyme required for sulfatase activity